MLFLCWLVAEFNLSPVFPCPANHLVANYEVGVDINVFEVFLSQILSDFHFNLNFWKQSNLVRGITILIVTATAVASLYQNTVPQLFLLFNLLVFFYVSSLFSLFFQFLFKRSVGSDYCKFWKLLLIELVHDRVPLFAHTYLVTLQTRFRSISAWTV